MTRPRNSDLVGTARSPPSSCLATQNFNRVRPLEQLRSTTRRMTHAYYR